MRSSCGPDVLLDKDGSVMLNPVGFVDYERISRDTGHRFERSKEAATGIAVRCYMNRSFFVAAPDAFTVSTQTIPDHARGAAKPETMADAQVSIVLAAVSGGMLEIGDNFPSLQSEPERLRLIEDPVLIDMVRLGRAAKPIDLMNFAPSDGQPSIFHLQESSRQSILAVFNWTEQKRDHDPTCRSGVLPRRAFHHRRCSRTKDGGAEVRGSESSHPAAALGSDAQDHRCSAGTYICGRAYGSWRCRRQSGPHDSGDGRHSGGVVPLGLW